MAFSCDLPRGLENFAETVIEVRVVGFAFPNYLHRPSQFLELSFNFAIPDDIRVKLGLPEINAGLRRVSESAPRMPVPEAPMDQKNHPMARKNNVRLAR